MVNLANDFTDADLRRVLRRALRTIAILTVLAAPIVWAAFGWRNVVLLIVGAAVSATGVWEWQRLLTVLIATMDVKPDNTANKPSTGPGSNLVLPPSRVGRGPSCMLALNVATVRFTRCSADLLSPSSPSALRPSGCSCKPEFHANTIRRISTF